MKISCLLLECDLVSPGCGFGRLEFYISFAAFINNGARSHFLCALATSHSKKSFAKRPKSVIWVFCQKKLVQRTIDQTFKDAFWLR